MQNYNFQGGKKKKKCIILEQLSSRKKCFFWKRFSNILFFSTTTWKQLKYHTGKSIFWSKGQCKEERDLSSIKSTQSKWVFRLSWCSLLCTHVLGLVFKKENPLGFKPVSQTSMPRKFMGKVFLEAISQLSPAHPSWLKMNSPGWATKELQKCFCHHKSYCNFNIFSLQI